jgi:hypothetical protein
MEVRGGMAEHPRGSVTRPEKVKVEVVKPVARRRYVLRGGRLVAVSSVRARETR